METVLTIIEISGMIVMIFAVLGIHELGHLITGLVLGFRFELFVVGPLGIKREDGRIKVYFNTTIAHYGGLAATIPTSEHADNHKKLAAVCLAGPIASLVLMLILGLLYYLFPSNMFLSTGTLASLGIFLATTLPSKTGGFFTDRKRYQRLTSNGPEREVEMAVLRVIGNYAQYDSYKNVAANDIEMMISDPHYKFFGLFTKLTYQFETMGAFDQETQNQYEEVSKKMPQSMVKATNKELQKVATA